MAISTFPVRNSNDWYAWAGDVDTAIRIAPTITDPTATFTSAGTLVGGARNAVDGTFASFTVTLPVPAGRGQTLLVERIDVNASTTISFALASGATLRGSTSIAATLPGVGVAFEALLFVAESATSWAVASGHKPKGWTDALYAPKVSPAFTGTPTAPTPLASDNSTTIATTAFVKSQGYITSAPGATDATTGAKGVIQLAGDLGGTAASPTVPTLSSKAPLASPTFTGVPSAPNPGAGTNTTQIATTQFVVTNTPRRSVGPTSNPNAQYTRIAQITTSNSNGAHLQALVSGLGNFGNGAKQSSIVTIGNYGNGASSQLTSFRVTNLTNGDGGIWLKARVTGTFTMELWALTANYNNEWSVTVLSASGAVLLMDSTSTSAPTSPTLSNPDVIFDVEQLAGGLIGVNTVTTSYTLVATDAGKLVIENSTAAQSITVPTNASVPSFPIGTVINFANVGTGALTIAAASGVSLATPTGAGYRLTTTNAQASIVKIATDTWLLSGQTAPLVAGLIAARSGLNAFARGSAASPPGSFAYRLRANEMGLSNGSSITSTTFQTGTMTVSSGGGSTSPTFLAGGQNTRSAIRFDGADDYLGSTSSPGLGSVYTFALVMDVKSVTGTREFMYSDQDVAINDIAANTYEMYAGSGLTGGTPSTGMHVLAWVYNGASSLAQVDGTQIISGNPGNGVSGQVQLARHPSQGRFAQIDLYEVIFYARALSGTELTALRSYVTSFYAF